MINLITIYYEGAKGFSILEIEYGTCMRSLLEVTYDTFNKKIWFSLLWVNFTVKIR